jgi:uncharacterized protein (TIGR00297 family)
MEWITIGLMIALCSALALFANHSNIFDKGGCATALVMGIFVSLTGSFNWLLLLIVLMVITYASTRFKFQEKELKGLQEGKSGSRGYQSVLANGGVACGIAFLTIFFSPEILAFPFVVAIASATSDVFASEIGGLSDKTYLITNLKRVKPGTNGGISWLGQGAAFGGSLFISIVGYLLFHPSFIYFKWILLAALLGFISCQLDSLLGATLEGRPIIKKELSLNKEGVNLTSILLISLLAFGLIR